MSQDQQIFSTAILSLQSPVPAGLTNGCGKVANRRFSVYRNNVMDSLIKALQTGFPVISKLLGEQNFKNIAGLFVRQHPPASPVINQYGDNFPAFLKDFKLLEHLPYLADTARLEFALRRSYHAADAKSVHPSEIDALSPEQLNAAELKMSPCAFLISSAWPIYGIWNYNTAPNAPKPPVQAQDVLVVRPNFDPYPVLLPPGGAIFFESLKQKMNFFDAVSAAQDDHTDFDLAAVLTIFLTQNVLIEIRSNSRERRQQENV
ncbi:MAG: DUF2063 domain-containing protein [Rhodobacteraceae bacterium]|nr:DUF2063 domain-containing protein [Paracoccaceae bacterium]